MKKFIQVFIGLTLLLALAYPALAQGVTPQHTDPGWQAAYWNNTALSGPPILLRPEGNLDYNWGTGSPGPGVNYDQFSAQWTRYIDVLPGTYQFIVTSDDGLRLWVDEELLIDQWHDQSATTYSAQKYLGPGHHLVRVDYFDNFGEAMVRVSWTQGTPPPTPTPPPPPPPPVYGGWRGEYFNNMSLSAPPALVRDDGQINFNWGDGSPAPGIINANNFSVRWSRNLDLPPGNYRFSMMVDDGARLFINGHLLIDAWKEQSPTAYSGDIYLPGGTITAQMEYFENTGGAVAQLSWMPGSTPPPPPPPPPAGPVGYVAAYRLNVRSGPGLYYPVINLLNRGQAVQLMGRDWSGKWLYMEAPNRVKGWVASYYIWSDVPLYQLPVLQ